MDDPSRVNLHDDEDIGDGEEGSVLGEEIACPKLFAIVVDEGAPGLATARRALARDHIAANCAGGMLDTELGREFLSDSVLTPLGVVARDACDEVDVRPGDAGSADPSRARLAAPHGLEALAVPGEYGSRLHDDEGAGAVRP